MPAWAAAMEARINATLVALGRQVTEQASDATLDRTDAKLATMRARSGRSPGDAPLDRELSHSRDISDVMNLIQAMQKQIERLQRDVRSLHGEAG
jgi:hypothetical protein